MTKSQNHKIERMADRGKCSCGNDFDFEIWEGKCEFALSNSDFYTFVGGGMTDDLHDHDEDDNCVVCGDHEDCHLSPGHEPTERDCTYEVHPASECGYVSHIAAVCSDCGADCWFDRHLRTCKFAKGYLGCDCGEEFPHRHELVATKQTVYIRLTPVDIVYPNIA